MIDIATEKAIDGWCGHETHLQATVVAARKARLAFVANLGRLHGDSITYFESLDRRMYGKDLTSRFMAEDMVVLNHHGTDTAMAPEVDI